MKDTLTRGMVLNNDVRVFCCRTTALVQDAVNKHDLWPTSAAALGRVLSVGCMMGSMLKSDKEKIEIQIDGQGQLGQIVVDAYNGGFVRGYVQNGQVYQVREEDHKLDVGGCVGTNGFLRVVKDMGMKQPFVSEVDLQSGEIGDDFAYYFMVSEQTPSAVSVGVLVDTDLSIKSAGGLIFQMMPGASEESIRIIEDIVRNIKPISQLLLEYDEPKDIINALFDDYEELSSSELSFRCECSREKFESVLKTLPTEDLQTMIDEDHGCEVKCIFCGSTYNFSEDELKSYIS